MVESIRINLTKQGVYMFAEEINEDMKERKDTSAEEIKEEPETIDENKPVKSAKNTETNAEDKVEALNDKADADVVKDEKHDEKPVDNSKSVKSEKITKDKKDKLLVETEIQKELQDIKTSKTQKDSIKIKDSAQEESKESILTKKEIKLDEPRKSKTESGRFEKRISERKRIDRRGLRQGIRREEYRNKSYDALPARDQNIKEIISSGNPDLINRTAEDYAKTWGDRPPWIKNRFSSFQIRPIISKILKIRKKTFAYENVNELKLLKPLLAYIARRYHDDDLYEFSRIIRYAIDDVGDDPQKFKYFCSFFDSLLLYFRANGGK